ncbi:hypothetical protein H696_02005 [Fonticula alba]|uniref:Acetyltransferase component of pyruvate dehydrogenase complex n=1 Tax=Fonticula alba TaxID=691883 RepID=A0A058Z9Z8_FONAL|nr:hypothetical protein H696_02005 [Fonticula alba]KCV71055.1 hypothetical protein H696_02005 [Fonticula alba]|eukprot:XP_009494178.1 hypothetical protein H696_02005 [Fonticula alba]
MNRALPLRSFSTLARVAFSAGRAPVAAPMMRSPAAAVLGSPSFGFFASRFYSSYPRHEKILMPMLSPSMSEGAVASWTKQEGDEITAGDTIASIETDKTAVDLNYHEDAFLARILLPAGETVPVLTPIGIVTFDKDDIAAFKDYKGEEEEAAKPAAPAAAAPTPAPAAAAAPTPTPAAAPAAASVATTGAGGRILASPVARKIARENSLDLAQIAGTGPNGRIVKYDVLEFLESGAAAAAPAAVPAAVPAAAPVAAKAAAPVYPPANDDYTEIPVSNIRGVIASRLLEAKTTIPHFYLTSDICMDAVLKLRKELNAQAESSLSVNDFIIKAASRALLRVPEANSAWAGSVIRRYTNADISVAVATDNGLITPIVRNANQLGLESISTTVKDLATRARAGRLAPAEFQGGTFTISNLGMFGVRDFAAIINPPQSCILAVGTVERRVVPAADSDAITTKQMMSVTLSCDHRVVDGAVGARWLQEFKAFLENPIRMLM